MTSFVFQDEAGVHAGFLGFPNHEGEWPPPGRHDCVFLRVSDEDAEGTVAGFIARHTGQAWSVAVSYPDGLMLATAELADGWTLRIRDGEETASWEASKNGEVLRGSGLFL